MPRRGSGGELAGRFVGEGAGLLLVEVDPQGHPGILFDATGLGPRLLISEHRRRLSRLAGLMNTAQRAHIIQSSIPLRLILIPPRLLHRFTVNRIAMRGR